MSRSNKGRDFHCRQQNDCGKVHGRIQGETDTLWYVDEARKRVLLIAASIIAARKLSQYDGGKRVPATVSAVADGIRWAEEILREIDRLWPVHNQDGKTM